MSPANRKHDDTELEIFPVMHNNVFYNLITGMDLELREIREMLDWIQEHQLMETQMKEHPDMPMICEIPLKEVTFVADIMNHEILIYKRIEKNAK